MRTLLSVAIGAVLFAGGVGSAVIGSRFLPKPAPIPTPAPPTKSESSITPFVFKTCAEMDRIASDPNRKNTFVEYLAASGGFSDFKQATAIGCDWHTGAILAAEEMKTANAQKKTEEAAKAASRPSETNVVIIADMPPAPTRERHDDRTSAIGLVQAERSSNCRKTPGGESIGLMTVTENITFTARSGEWLFTPKYSCWIHDSQIVWL